MQQISNISYILGNSSIIDEMKNIKPLPLFYADAVEFLGTLSKRLLQETDRHKYPDIVTLGFWCRKAAINKVADSYSKTNRLGKGVVFHIAPSNVAVNFAYSCIAAFLSGNASIVRLPSKDFPQISIIVKAFNDTLAKYPEFKAYFLFVRYPRIKEINDYFSAISAMRIIWGGDNTIYELRKSPLPPRASDIAFADRFSIAIINADEYLTADNKNKIAKDFYNDTYLFDQNACTSPRLIVWLGKNISVAKLEFWNNLASLINDSYNLPPVKAVDKLTSACILATKCDSKITTMAGNLIFRLQVSSLEKILLNFKPGAGFFLEYDAGSISELTSLFSTEMQTISYYGFDSNSLVKDILALSPMGIDRIVPMGKTLDFSLVWDGIDLILALSRKIVVK